MLVRREGDDDFVKVLDFGLAQVSRHIAAELGEENRAPTAPRITQVGEIFGTPAYMAPEQTVGAAVDSRTDLYALGVVLYEMLTGVRPFTGKSPLEYIQQHLATPPPLLKDRAPHVKVSPGIESLMRRLLAKQPADRYANPQELLAAIDELAAEESISLHGVSAIFKVDSRSSYPLITPTPTPTATPLQSAGRSRLSTMLERARTMLFPESTATEKIKKSIFRFARIFQKKDKRLLRSLSRLPRAILVTAGLLVIVLAIGAGWLIKSPATARSQKGMPAPTREIPEPLATQIELDAATAQGSVALETLASRFASDPRVLRALAKSYSVQRQHIEAMRVLGKLAAIDPATGRDAELARYIVSALQGNSEANQAAVSLMEHDLGAPGIDLMYDLTIKQTQARWKTRLHQSLSKPEVLALASPATRIALELRAAKSCEAKRDLLPKVAREGGERALALLKGLTQTGGCGFLGTADCWSCLRKEKESALKEAIAALESHPK